MAASDDESQKIQAAYKEGQLDERLAGFDKHFQVINGSVERTAVELRALRTMLEERLNEKAERARVHELLAQVSAIELRVAASEASTVHRTGPVMDMIMKNSRRLDALEAAEPAQHETLKAEMVAQLQVVKIELVQELQGVREQIADDHHSGMLRRWAAAGSAFAVAFGIILAIAHEFLY